MPESYYQLLQIEESASGAEIRRAFLSQAKRWHPDTAPAGLRDSYEARFQRLAEAFETLSDPVRRAQYDGHPRTVRRRTPQTAADPNLANWHRKLKRAEVAARVDGRHYTEHVATIKELKRNGRHGPAIALLLRVLDAIEAEAAIMGEDWALASWYYECLAIIYRKERRYAAEIAILERYAAKSGAHRSATVFEERLKKGRQLRDRAYGFQSRRKPVSR